MNARRATSRLALAVAMVLPAFASAARTGEGVEVVVQSGTIAGVAQGDVLTFKGVPFAAPPVGALRWQAPQPPARWTGVRAARDYGADCVSKPDPKDSAPLRTTPSEDCLYLNVWRPASASKPLPVLVWIYGGGFTTGGTSPLIYDGSALAKQGVMVVSFNYRVGPFGFFAHPALAREQAGKPRGNYGFLDQIAAMRWIRENIAAFGGDPGNVTVFGESAGGFSVHMLLTSPIAAGLMNKAVIQSGGGRRTVMHGQRMNDDGLGRRPAAVKTGLRWAESIGITGDDAIALAKLRALPTAEVEKSGGFYSPYYSGPMIDGDVVPFNMMEAYTSGRYAHIPLMIGATTADLGLNKSKDREELFGAFGANAAKAKALYDPDGSALFTTVRASVGADEMMTEPARFTARQFVAGGSPAYLYRFGYVASHYRGALRGALHASDVPYAFNTVDSRYQSDTSADDRAMAEAMSGYLVAFAKTGDPNGGGRPRWDRYDPKSDEVLSIGDRIEMKPDPWKQRLDLVETINQKIAE